MSKLDIIRAWKDEAYRNSLSTAEQAQLPQNPAGEITLSDAELAGVDGGTQVTSTVQPTHYGQCYHHSFLALCYGSIYALCVRDTLDIFCGHPVVSVQAMCATPLE